MDVYKRVTSAIVAAIEKDTGKVTMPWNRAGGSIPFNATTDQSYNGINILWLWCEAESRGYGDAAWATYRQWAEYGAQVRKGERSSLIIFYKQFTKENDDGEEEARRILKSYSVFNAAQVDGYKSPAMTGDPIDRIAIADEYVSATGAVIHHGGGRAFYRPGTDDITMPDEERFIDTDTSTRTEGYYSTLLHELAHWSGHKSRLDRDMKGRFGDEGYAMEELVAELAAAFQCAHLGITPEPRVDHAQYIANWLQVLKGDKKAIFTAAAKAQQAVDYLRQ